MKIEKNIIHNESPKTFFTSNIEIKKSMDR